jgi:hypothetical protein
MKSKSNVKLDSKDWAIVDTIAEMVAVATKIFQLNDAERKILTTSIFNTLYEIGKARRTRDPKNLM